MYLVHMLSDRLWYPCLLGLFFLAGGYFSFGTGFFQLFGMKSWLGGTFGKLKSAPHKKGKKGGLDQFSAMITALGATVGTSSIAGVATAIYYGGAGAVFWMWLSAFFGMMTAYAEKVLTIYYRKKDEYGQWVGGPSTYIADGLHMPKMAKLFSLFCLLASLSGGNLVQANAIAVGLESATGQSLFKSGCLLALLVGLVILGGIGRIGKVSSTLVPAMAILFVGGGILVLWVRRDAIPEAFSMIFSSLYSTKSAVGGVAGYSVASALRYGVARGVFTNEAGMGSSAMAHAVADVDKENTQGLWGMVEVFLATLVIATITALVVLTAGVYDPQKALDGSFDFAMVGVPLVVASFEVVMGKLAAPFVSLCLTLFAFSSILGWSYYGECSLKHLLGSHKRRFHYRMVFLLFLIIGSISNVTVVWEIADICNGMMAIPNLIALLLLSPKVFAIWRREN